METLGRRIFIETRERALRVDQIGNADYLAAGFPDQTNTASDVTVSFSHLPRLFPLKYFADPGFVDDQRSQL